MEDADIIPRRSLLGIGGTTNFPSDGESSANEMILMKETTQCSPRAYANMPFTNALCYHLRLNTYDLHQVLYKDPAGYYVK